MGGSDWLWQPAFEDVFGFPFPSLYSGDWDECHNRKFRTGRKKNWEGGGEDSLHFSLNGSLFLDPEILTHFCCCCCCFLDVAKPSMCLAHISDWYARKMEFKYSIPYVFEFPGKGIDRRRTSRSLFNEKGAQFLPPLKQLRKQRELFASSFLLLPPQNGRILFSRISFVRFP